jgi:hypothetical protein
MRGRLELSKLKGRKWKGGEEGWRGKSWENFPLPQLSTTPGIMKSKQITTPNISSFPKHIGFWTTIAGLSKFRKKTSPGPGEKKRKDFFIGSNVHI